MRFFQFIKMLITSKDFKILKLIEKQLGMILIKTGEYFASTPRQTEAGKKLLLL